MAMAGSQDTSKGKSGNIMKRAREVPANVCRALWKLGRDDPRRPIHAMKVGLALTLVSFLYVLEPLFERIGHNAMWAVMTVVVVLEFTAGATLCKGFNRGLGTLCAGSLAFFIEFVAEKSRREFRAVFVGASVFVIGFLSTYIRFYPHIKKNYDYGVVVFLLTFNLITVSSYRVQNVFHLAQQRLYTIAIGCGICLAMAFLIVPHWSGEDLRSSTVYKLEGLARSIEACVNEYFKDKEIAATEEAEASKESIEKGYRAVLDSKSSDESLAHFSSWEPRFSRQCHKYPWHRYVKIGAIMRHFAYTAAALHGCLESQIQAPKSVRSLFRDPCNRVAREVSTVLLELSTSIEKGRRVSPDSFTDRLEEALQALNSAIKSQPRLSLGSSSANRMLVEWKHDKENSPRVTLKSARTDMSALFEFRNKRAPDPSKDQGQQRAQLRPSMSKLAMTSLEFSEALPFAAFAYLLVEMVARLDLVIHEVEELGRDADFKEFSRRDDIVIDINDNGRRSREGGREIHHHHASQVGE